MSLRPTRRVLIASVLTALAAPAWPQSYFHAPPAPAADGPLPVIRPGVSSGGDIRSPFDGWGADRRTAGAKKGVAPATPAANPMARSTGPRPIWVPAHLSASQWSKAPEADIASVSPRPVAAAPLPTITPKGARPARVNAPPIDADRARQLAAEAIARGEGKRAERILAQAAERFPTDVQLVSTLARTRESQRDWYGAIIAYDVLERLDPSEPRWRIRRAECRFRVGQFARATADYRSAAAASTLSFDEYARFGDAALRAGDPATAEEAFTALSKLRKESLPQVELLRGLAALKQGKAAEARAILLQASARWPKDVATAEAFRLAAEARYGHRPVATANVAVTRAIEAATTSMADEESSPDEPTIVETAGERAAEKPTTAMEIQTADIQAADEATADEEPVPVISGWRPTRPRPAPEHDAVSEAMPLMTEETPDESSDGWRAAEPRRLDDVMNDTAPRRLPVEAPR